MNRTKRFFYNSISTACLQILNMLSGFIIPSIMLNIYGSEINGLVSSIAQFITYFNLVEAGLSGAAVYALYKPLADNDYKAISGIVSASKKFYIQSGYIFIGLTFVLAIIYPFYIKTNVLSNFEIFFLVLILGVNGVLEFFTLSKYRVILTADQRTYVISIASIIHIIINTFIIVILSKFYVNIVILRFIALFSIFIRSIILLLYCKKKYNYINYNEIPNNKALNKRWDALYLQVLGAIHTGAPVVIITLVIKNLKIVSIYSIFNMVISGVNNILGIFTSGLAASFGDLIARNEIKVFQKAYREFEFIYYTLIAIVYSVSFIMIMPFINIYTSNINDINYNIPIVGFLFVLNGFLYNIKTPQGMLVISAGMYKETRWQTTIQGLISVVFGVIFAKFLGIKGVLIGSILSNVYRDIDLLFFIPKKLTKLPVMYTFVRILRLILSVLIIYIPFIFIKLNINNYIQWLLNAILVVIYATIVVVTIGIIFDKKEILNIYKRIIRMIGVKN